VVLARESERIAAGCLARTRPAAWQTKAGQGRTEVLIDSRDFRRHAPWFLASALALLAASLWYASSWISTGDLPGGSSAVGIATGVAGGLIIIFELAFWWRKWVRTWRIGRVQAWLRAHIWLGLLTLPLLVLHSGFRFGGPLSTVLLLLLVVVVASGIFGLILQNILPRRMLLEVPAETIYSQIGPVSEDLADQGERLVRATCGEAEEETAGGPRSNGETAAIRGGGIDEEAAAPAAPAYRTVGAVRVAGKVQGRVLETRVTPAPVEGAEALREFFETNVVVYLRRGASSRSALAVRSRSASMFEDLRTKLPPAAHRAAEALEAFCEERRQFDAQARLHRWLHGWLLIHGPLSLALVLLMVIHAWVALKYW
jgi:hypothetical protein